MYIDIFAFTILSILALLSLFQLALIFGAPLGRFAWGGAHKILPRRLRIGSAISILVYAFVALVVAEKAGLLSLALNATFVMVSLWVLFAYFVVGIFLNGISKSKPERFVMTPVCLLLAVCTFFVAQAGFAQQAAQSMPNFAFNEQAAPEWWAVPNYNSRAEAIKDGNSQTPIEKLPVVYRGLFTGDRGMPGDTCFVTFDYYDTKADVTALLQSKLDESERFQVTYTQTGKKDLVISTPEGSVNYQLYQFDMDNPDDADGSYMRGYEWAYVDVKGGYISISGVCPAATDLDSTLGAIRAMSFTRTDFHENQ